MSKHDDFGTALPRLASTVAARTITVTPFRATAPAIAVVARPSTPPPVAVQHASVPAVMAMAPAQLAAQAFASAKPVYTPIASTPLLATPSRPALDMTVRPSSPDPVLAAINSPAGREAAAAAAGIVGTGLSLSPNTIVSQLPVAQGASPNTSGNGVGAPDDGGAGGAVDSGQSTDWGDPSTQDWSDSATVTSGTPATALALVPGSTLAPSAAAKVASATLATPAVAESFWSKLLALFGFGKKAAVTPPAPTVHGEAGSTQAMVESVVRRSRNGDQNAMALIALVRDNAKKGNPKAQHAFTLLQEYVRTHPVDSNPRIGLDPDYVAMTQAPGTRWAGESDATFSDAVALSHGPLLTDGRIHHMLSRFGAEDRKGVLHGMANPHSTHPHRGVRLGKILGQARRLQAVRMRNSSLHKFDPRVGAELDG